MINQLILFSIKNKLVIGLFTLAIIAGGIWSMTQIPLDAVPDITNNQVQIITQSPSLGTEDIEQFVTYPIELAMANLPGVIEIRSVSRFGLSLVTIVFEDNMGNYLPRQLVSEKLNTVKAEIPAGFGIPTMGPISTGLGEIYQYTLKVDSTVSNQYSTTELRTIQDWIVARQMAMVPGVVEVNAFGGSTKQYEVAVNPNELKAIGITILDIFKALEANNENTGGAYIEKDHFANFIRGEGLARSIADIESIVVANIGGLPITIKDVATVRFGEAVKYGALTKDGNGEAVGGMILMLKGANSNNVINAVKLRITEIEKSLPKGISIEPFLDRSILIDKTTSTVGKNLMEGALIVIFVLVFLLGNWRGGIIVASTIPLSLLFAFILMNVFDVWANLMSLGAIDFGIIIDGAVIIVEATVFAMHGKLLAGKSITKQEADEISFTASSKMMNSAFFGQLIILLVFVPILALQGVEGKMFKPMALTFMFSMVGVMILCLTYVPMMSAWLIGFSKSTKLSWGDKIVVKLENLYEAALVKTMKQAKLLLGSAVVMLALALFAFTNMGGEFMPKLDEGDIAFHVILKPGSSLSESIATTTKVEQIIKAKFPEAKHVISRIGVADVPTDPMPMDIADCFIILNPESAWRPNLTKAQLIQDIKNAIQVVPGLNFEFTQPIEMRFNELITGVREDVAVKLFGEDLQVLSDKANDIGRIIASVEGVADMKVEATDGLPQITIRYKRNKLAQYGLNISEVNTLVQTAFGGGFAGVIFEGEKRFDLVVRLDKNHRSSIDDLQNLYVNLPNGAQIPMNVIADISYQPGPMQISRDNTNRRTYVGINVRGRDVKSVVEEIKQKLDAELVLPPGYYIKYGGAFENLERATNRLKMVVPVALLLIFLLIFLALKSVKQTVMIYMAIPLALIGGVFALWIRDMPFSISAGVGFIVLFGVAVLNGLVLISSWNELKDDGETDIDKRIRLGAKRRIRPILLTALTDILGFLPMAISTSAGAEVQQPLATVVIGGMLSATLLTLFVLPNLYRWTEQRSAKVNFSKAALVLLLIGSIVVLPLADVKAQSLNNKPITTLEEVLEIGLLNNGSITIAKTNIELQEQSKKSAFNLDKTNVSLHYGQFNSFENDNGVSVSQNFEFPTVYTSQRKLATEQVKGSELQLQIAQNELTRNIKQAWYQLVYLHESKRLFLFQDSLFAKFLEASIIRYETQAISYLELVAAETKVMEASNLLNAVELDIAIQEKQLRWLMNDSSGLTFSPPELTMRTTNLVTNPNEVAGNALLSLYNQRVNIANAQRKMFTAKLLPDISVGYFNQSMIGLGLTDGTIASGSNRFSSVQVGLSIPLFFGSYKADIKSAKLKTDMAQTTADYQQSLLQAKYQQQLFEVQKYQSSYAYYQKKAVPQAMLILATAQKSLDAGAINYVEYFQNVNQALEIRLNSLTTLNEYNQRVINLEYLIGQ